MAQPDDETARDLLDRANLPEEQYVAIKTMVDGLVSAGFTTGEALYWTAVHIAALNKIPDYDEEAPDGG